MAAMMGEKDGAGTTCPSSAITDRPPPIPSRAVRIGSPMARNEPNAMSSTTAAATAPKASESPP